MPYKIQQVLHVSYLCSWLCPWLQDAVLLPSLGERTIKKKNKKQNSGLHLFRILFSSSQLERFVVDSIITGATFKNGTFRFYLVN